MRLTTSPDGKSFATNPIANPPKTKTEGKRASSTFSTSANDFNEGVHKYGYICRLPGDSILIPFFEDGSKCRSVSHLFRRRPVLHGLVHVLREECLWH